MLPALMQEIGDKQTVFPTMWSEFPVLPGGVKENLTGSRLRRDLHMRGRVALAGKTDTPHLQPMTPDEKQLLLYIASKVARLDAITTAIHQILYTDLAPSDPTASAKRNWVVQRLYTENIQGEKEHLKTQFPDDYEVMAEYIALGERAIMDKGIQTFLGMLDGSIELPEVFKDPPAEERPSKSPPEGPAPDSAKP